MMAREKGVPEILAAFLEDSGYLKYLIKNNEEEKIDLLNQFYKKVKSFEETTLEPTLNNFINEINLELESGEEGKLEFDPEQGPEMIKVMTIHGAKGLEFRYVFLVSMVDKRFPTIERKDPIELPEELIKDIKPKGDVHLQEERRICYVAMTRAKKGLYFTSAYDYGGQREKKPSRFLVELGFGSHEADSSQNISARSTSPTRPALREGLGSPAPSPLARRHILLASKANKRIPAKFLPKHFSYSQLAAFEKCPLQYKFGFILKVPVRGKAMFSFGKTMHNTLYKFLKEANESSILNQASLFEKKSEIRNPRSETNPNFQNLEEIYEKSWIDEWYPDKKNKEEYRKKGREILKDFYEDFKKNPPKILKINNSLALELPFNLKIGEHTLFGVIDRIDQTSEGVKIIDYKTGQSKDKLDFENKEQLLIYQIAAEEVLGLKPKELVYYYLEGNKKVSFLGTEPEIKNQKEKIIQEIEKIENSEFEPTPGWQCQYCDFKDICNFAQRF